jgi:hypothetical protein
MTSWSGCVSLHRTQAPEFKGCQRAIPEQSVTQGGNYVLDPKDNQGTLHEGVEDFADLFIASTPFTSAVADPQTVPSVSARVPSSLAGRLVHTGGRPDWRRAASNHHPSAAYRGPGRRPPFMHAQQPLLAPHQEHAWRSCPIDHASLLFRCAGLPWAIAKGQSRLQQAAT